MSERRNIILLTADSLRADHVGALSNSSRQSLTQNLDAFASQSAVWTNSYSQGPYTTFSMPSLFTGRYPCELRQMSFALRWTQPAGVVVNGSPTIQSLLKENGYATAGFHSNPLLSRLFGFDESFDTFFDDVWLGDDGLPDRIRLYFARLHRIFRIDPYLSARKLNKRVMDWIRENKSRPFFLWVHYMDTHGPYTSFKVLKYLSPAERLWRKADIHPDRISAHEREQLHKGYCRQVRRLDRELGRILKFIDEELGRDQTAIFFGADHGDEFGEHGGYSHKHKLYDELLHVPLMLRMSGVEPGPRNNLVELRQVLPTILQMVGDARAEKYAPSLLRDDSSNGDLAIVSEAGRNCHDVLAIRTRDWKFVQHADSRTELYDVQRDPYEKENMALVRPDIATYLAALLEEHKRGKASIDLRQDVPALVSMSRDEEILVEERLRELGYL